MAAVKPNALPWLGASALVLVLDQLTKAWVLASLPEYTAVPVIDGFWNWYRTYNTGAAFSFLADAGGWQKWFFTVLAFGISGLMAWMLSRTPRNDWKQALPLALVVGGAIGVFAQPTTKAKCVRCWHHRGDVGAHAAHPQLCGRCVSNIEGPGEDRMWF